MKAHAAALAHGLYVQLQMPCRPIKSKSQVLAFGEAFKGIVAELGMSPGCCRHFLGKGRLFRHEVRAIPLDCRGGCMDIDAQALTKAQFAGAAR